MKERPILFSAPMIRALLDGSKSQTRRICKSQPYSNGYKWDGHDILCHNDYLPPSAMLMDCGGKSLYTTSDVEGWESECPYGQPGDRLWVRETFLPDPSCDDAAWDDHTDTYQSWSGCGSAISGVPASLRNPENCIYKADWSGSDLVWRPSIHMPRWASRILLEIVSVRVERLNEISEDDCWAEGIEACDGLLDDMQIFEMAKQMGRQFEEAAPTYAALWESLNGAGSWAANPFVWCISFRMVAC